MTKKILIVEDEEQIVQLIKNRLDSTLYHIDIALDGKEALLKINENNYDLITLDIMLPHIDGFEITKLIRKKSYLTLIVMVSALDTDEFKIKGYDNGVDDYMSKPFSAKELSVKIKSLLKRREELSSLKSKHLSNIILNEESKEVSVNGFKVRFTPSEYLILTTLINSKNRVYSRAELAQIIYDNNLGERDNQNCSGNGI